MAKKKSNRDIWEEGAWASRRKKHRRYAELFEGKHLKETTGRRNRETGKKARKYPLDINLIKLACGIHRDVARGIPVRDQPLIVRAVVERTEAIGEMAKALGRDRGTIRRRVAAALSAGTLEEVVVRRQDSAGRMFLSIQKGTTC